MRVFVLDKADHIHVFHFPVKTFVFFSAKVLGFNFRLSIRNYLLIFLNFCNRIFSSIAVHTLRGC